MTKTLVFCEKAHSKRDIAITVSFASALFLSACGSSGGIRTAAHVQLGRSFAMNRRVVVLPQHQSVDQVSRTLAIELCAVARDKPFLAVITPLSRSLLSVHVRCPTPAWIWQWTGPMTSASTSKTLGSTDRSYVEDRHPTMGRRPSFQSFPMIRHRHPQPAPQHAVTLRGPGPWRPISTSRFRTGRAQLIPPHARHSQASLVSVDPVAGQRTLSTVAARVAPGSVAFALWEQRSACRVPTPT